MDPHFKDHGKLGLEYSYQCLSNTFELQFLVSPEFQDTVCLRKKFMDTLSNYLEHIYVEYRIHKAILDNINKRLCTSLNINQWKNTESVIDWFKRIEQKHLYKFIMFDIKDFYP